MFWKLKHIKCTHPEMVFLPVSTHVLHRWHLGLVETWSLEAQSTDGGGLQRRLQKLPGGWEWRDRGAARGGSSPGVQSAQQDQRGKPHSPGASALGSSVAISSSSLGSGRIPPALQAPLIPQAHLPSRSSQCSWSPIRGGSGWSRNSRTVTSHPPAF